MRDEDIDDILRKLADDAPSIEPALLDRIWQSVGSGLQRAPSIPPSWILVTGLMLLCALIGGSGGILLGAHGVHSMTSLQVGVILVVLGFWMWAAASQCVVESIPGSRRFASPVTLALCCSVTLTALFAILFREYTADRFVAQGVKCVAAGLGIAIPAALGIWLILSRGFPTNLAASGFARGMLAGLAGITMLELHCPNLEVPHLLVWHIGVLPLSGLAGVLASRAMLKI